MSLLNSVSNVILVAVSSISVAHSAQSVQPNTLNNDYEKNRFEVVVKSCSQGNCGFVRLVKPEDKNEIDFIKENSEGIEIVRRVVDGQETEIYNRKKEAKNG